jgi:hypothetical protein
VLISTIICESLHPVCPKIDENYSLSFFLLYYNAHSRTSDFYVVASGLSVMLVIAACFDASIESSIVRIQLSHIVIRSCRRTYRARTLSLGNYCLVITYLTSSHNDGKKARLQIDKRTIRHHPLLALISLSLSLSLSFLFCLSGS